VQQTREKILDISWETIFKISVAIICFYIVYSIRDILIWFVFALIISVLFNPAIDFLQRKKIPRILGVVSVYVFVFGIFSLLIYLVLPFFTYEIQQFLESLPQYFERISPPLRGLGFQAFENTEVFVRALEKTLETMAGNILNVLFTFFGGVFSTLFVITTAIFLSVEEKVIERSLMLLFPKRYEAYALNLWGRCQKKVAGWFGARLLACLFVGVVSYVTFLLFHVKYPFTLGLFAAVFNFIPYIGPLLTGILLFLVVFPIDILKAIFVLIAFTLIQLVEGNLLSPILMKKIVGLPPALVLVSLVIGGKLWGLLGAILIIPLAGILFEFFREFLQKRKEKEAVVV
jgi:predicted PurR-regulated permease PerM